MSDREFYVALLPHARRELAKLGPEDDLARLEIESVEVEDGDEHGMHIAVRFRDPARPECRFGWRWSWTEGPRPEEVEFAASVLATNLEEDVISDRYGLPAECEPDAITWF
jgi:hypothetical protein